MYKRQDIYDIPIVEITEQYLHYASKMPKDDLDLASEFLVMAATLIDIKSKMLLPKAVSYTHLDVYKRQSTFRS